MVQKFTFSILQILFQKESLQKIDDQDLLHLFLSIIRDFCVLASISGVFFIRWWKSLKIELEGTSDGRNQLHGTIGVFAKGAGGAAAPPVLKKFGQNAKNSGKMPEFLAFFWRIFDVFFEIKRKFFRATGRRPPKLDRPGTPMHGT